MNQGSVHVTKVYKIIDTTFELSENNILCSLTSCTVKPKNLSQHLCAIAGDKTQNDVIKLNSQRIDLFVRNSEGTFDKWQNRDSQKIHDPNHDKKK